MPKSDTKPTVPGTYIFNAYFEKGKIISKLSHLPNSIIALEQVDSDSAKFSNTKKAKKPVILRTDQDGRLKSLISPKDESPDKNKSLSASSFFHSVETNKEVKSIIVIPPIDVVSYLAAAKVGEGAQWADDLLAALSTLSPDGLPAIKLERNIPLKNLEKPKATPKSEEEKRYARWYQDVKRLGKPIQGYILAKTRAILLIINKSVPVDKDIKPRISRAGKQAIPATWADSPTSDDYHIATLSGTEVTLPQGLYKIRINLDIPEEQSTNWNNGYANKNYYELSAWLNFDIKNAAGTFSMVNCDPISVEEVAIKQYSRFYSHLLDAAKELNQKEEVADPRKKIITNETSAKSQPVAAGTHAQGFLQYAASWKVMKESSQLSVKLSTRDLSNHIDADGNHYKGKQALMFDVAKALHEKLGEAEDPRVKSAIDFGLATKEGIDAWAEFAEKRKKYITAINDGTLQSASAALKQKYWIFPSASNTPQAEIDAYRNSALGKIGVPKFATDLFGRGMQIIDAGITTKAIAEDGAKLILETIPAKKAAKENYKKVAESYFNIFGESKELANVTITEGFEFDSPNINKNSNIVKTIAKEAPKIQEGLALDKNAVVYVGGHTCDIGSTQYNQKLSEDRANTIKKLLEEAGIPSDKIKAEGHGEFHPITDNINKESRSKNRRVEILVLAPLTSEASPSREGIDTLERYRSISIQRSIQVDEDAIKLALQVADIALGVMAVIPATAHFAAAIIAIKATKDAVISASKVIDEYFCDQAIGEYFADRQRIQTLSKESSANQHMLHELFDDKQPGEKLTATKDTIWAAQYRLRAEAVAGLVELLVRASIKASSPQNYAERLVNYKIHEYIKNFIIGDEWSYPLNGVATVKMAEYWLYAVNPYSHKREMFEEARLKSYGLDKNYILVAPASENKTAQSMADFAGREERGGSPSAAGGHYMIKIKQSPVTDTLSAKFHAYFPIHTFATGDIKKFGETFNPVFASYGRDDLLKTAVYYQDIDSRKWHLYKDAITAKSYRNRKVTHYPSLSPYTPIRILLVFKKESSSILPLSIKLKRTDGINITGPTYKSLALPLAKTDLIDYLGEEQYEGYTGCVFYPFFCLGKKTFRGIKPLAGDIAFWYHDNAAEYNNSGYLRNMYYAFHLTIGKNSSDYAIPLDSELDSDGNIKLDKDFFNSVADDIKVGIKTEKRPGELALLEQSFLVSKTAEYNYAPLFSGDTRVRVLARVGGENSEYFMPAFTGGKFLTAGGTVEEPKKNIFHDVVESDLECKMQNIELSDFAATIRDFSWDTRVEFVFIFSCTKLLTEGYEDETAHSDYRQIPMSVNMVEDSRWQDGEILSSDMVGPKLTGTLQLLGTATRTGAIKPQKVGTSRFKFSDDNFEFKIDRKRIPGKPFKRDANLRPILNILCKNDDKARALIGWQRRAGAHNDEDTKRYVYAANISCKYMSPKGVEVNSIRPFGKGIWEKRGDFDDYIQFYFNNFEAMDGTKIGTVDHNGGSAFMFNFKSPRSFVKNVPWAKAMPKKLFDTYEEVLSDEQKTEFLSNEFVYTKDLQDWLENPDLNFSPLSALEESLRRKN